jgi:hypothetical protein
MLKHNHSFDIGTLPARVKGNWKNGIVGAGLTIFRRFHTGFRSGQG